MRNIETRLLMVFSTTLGRKVSLFVSNPKENITETAIETKVVQTATTGYDLVI
ncbi:DUF2922 family protein [Paraclostridium bifermentans]|uniref:DUF2922 family protein n=1 Tax=Paraclostridium bifermentans TaxID=1490 RepID=A0A5P3XC31_PARBF|nr:DUF2922 family protein [Paraclostridium bifermentans]QEZ68479.1 DUF2922 family protein [Paraclostridium bifermentans]